MKFSGNKVTLQDPRFKDPMFGPKVQQVLNSMGLPYTWENFTYWDQMWSPDTPSLDWASLSLVISTGQYDRVAIVHLVDEEGMYRGKCGTPEAMIDPDQHRIVGWL